MGIAESKILGESLLSACHTAEKEGKDRLDERQFWKDVNIIKASKSIYRYIPRDIRGTSRQPAIKKAIARASRQLEVPQVVQDLQDKRESLFIDQSTAYSADGSPITPQSSPSSTPISMGISSLAESYKLIKNYEEQQDLGKIRLRLLYVSFFRLKNAVQPVVTQYHNYDSAVFISQMIIESGACGDTLDVVKSRVRRWIGLGERYSLLADDLGGLGALYILPDNGGESIWTKELRKSATNANRVAMIKNLRHLGLPEEAGNRDLHSSAEQEVAKILGPMKISLDQVLEKQLGETSYRTSGESQPTHPNETGNYCLRSDLPQLHRTGSGILPSQINTPFAMQMASLVATPLDPTHDGQRSLELIQDTRRPFHDLSESPTSLETRPEFRMPRFQPRELANGRMPQESIPHNGELFQHGNMLTASSAQFSVLAGDQNDHCSNPLDAVGPSIATVTPADFPQAFALASTMTPADYPLLFPFQQRTVTPADYPQMFPFDPSQGVGSSSTQTAAQAM